jgi:single-strand DNA-binding protein
MNKVVIIGRFTRDPEIKYTTGENATATARFSLAVNRRFKNKEGNYDADFINCVAFGKTAEFIEKYFTKGMAIGITGRIQTGSYTNKEGQKIYTTDVVVEETEFVESKNKGTSDNVPNNNANSNSDFEETVSDDEMPF